MHVPQSGSIQYFMYTLGSSLAFIAINLGFLAPKLSMVVSADEKAQQKRLSTKRKGE